MTDLETQLSSAVREGSLVRTQEIIKEHPELLHTVISWRYAGSTVLHVAAQHNRFRIIKWLLASREWEEIVNIPSTSHHTAMHLAAWFGHLKSLQLLAKLSKKQTESVNINAQNDTGKTLLHCAALRGHAHIISWLLSNEKGGGRRAGFNAVLARTSRNDFSLTALHCAARKDDFQTFLAIVDGCNEEEKKELLNAVQREGWTVLHVAAYHGSLEIAKWLLSDSGGRAAGFDSVLAKTSNGLFVKKGSTALHIAAQRGKLEIFLVIVDGSKIDNGERGTLLNDAVDDDDLTVLHRAADQGHASIVSWLVSLESGFNRLTAKTTKGRTALHLAANSSNLETFLAIVNSSKMDQEDRKAMLNSVDNNGWTVLHYAAQGAVGIVEWLLSEEGASSGFDRELLLRRDNTGNSVINIVCDSLRQSAPAALSALLSASTQFERVQLFTMRDKRGWTALHAAIGGRNQVEELAELVKWPECALAANVRDNRGLTALHRAICKGVDKASFADFYWYGGDKSKIAGMLLDTTVGKGLGTVIDVNLPFQRE